MTAMEVRDLFASKNLRCTRQRVVLYEALAATRAHPTADELRQLVDESAPGMSLATVYNTLECLCDAGLCRRIATLEGGTRYDADLTDHLHVVTEDGRVIDVPADLGEQLLQRLPRDLLEAVESSLGVRISRVNVELVARNDDRSDNPPLTQN